MGWQPHVSEVPLVFALSFPVLSSVASRYICSQQVSKWMGSVAVPEVPDTPVETLTGEVMGWVPMPATGCAATELSTGLVLFSRSPGMGWRIGPGFRLAGATRDA